MSINFFNLKLNDSSTFTYQKMRWKRTWNHPTYSTYLLILLSLRSYRYMVFLLTYVPMLLFIALREGVSEKGKRNNNPAWHRRQLLSAVRYSRQCLSLLLRFVEGAVGWLCVEQREVNIEGYVKKNKMKKWKRRLRRWKVIVKFLKVQLLVELF